MSDQATSASSASQSSGLGTGGPLRTIAAAEFKAKCLKVLDDVRDSGAYIVITKHGHPVAKLVPVDATGSRPPLIGSHKGQISYAPDETFENATLAEMDAWESNLDESPSAN